MSPESSNAPGDLGALIDDRKRGNPRDRFWRDFRLNRYRLLNLPIDRYGNGLQLLNFQNDRYGNALRASRGRS